MKTIAKDNIKKIRKENTKGNFSTLKNSIKNDTRLSPTSRFILLEVFSSSDEFAYSESYMIKFLGISRNTYYKFRDELIENGYLKINTNVKMKSQNYYIFSEFGNFKSNDDNQPSNNEDNSQPEANPEVTQNNPKAVQPKVVDELCTMEDFERLGFDLKLNTIVNDIINEGYDVDTDKLLDMFFTKVTKKQLEKGLNLDKLKKTIIEKFATKIAKFTDKELEEMITAKANGLTIGEKKSILFTLKKRITENPNWTITEISSKILSLIADAFSAKNSNVDQYYQN